MSNFGALVTNAAGRLVFSDKRLLPVFVGKPTLFNTFARVSATTNYIWSWMYQLASGDGLQFYGIAMPSSTRGEQYQLAWNGNFVTVSILRPQSQGTDVPVMPDLYAFRFSNAGPGGQKWGLRTWDASNNIVSDLSRPVAGIYDIPVVTPGGSFVGISNMPAKPGFMLFYTARTSWVRSGSSSNGTRRECFFLRSGSSIVNSEIITGSEGADSPYSGTEYYGMYTPQGVPVFNAAAFD